MSIFVYLYAHINISILIFVKIFTGRKIFCQIFYRYLPKYLSNRILTNILLTEYVLAEYVCLKMKRHILYMSKYRICQYRTSLRSKYWKDPSVSHEIKNEPIQK